MARVCVIGGGVSGLAAACLLANNGYTVDLVEQSGRAGGNAYTMEVVLDDKTGETRWVDMGVNDFNANTYKFIVGMLDELGVPYKPLLDEASFCTEDGTYCYTIGQPNGGRWNTPMDPQLQADFSYFMANAWSDVSKDWAANLTIAEYLQSPRTGHQYDPDLGRYCIFPRVNGMYFTVDDIPQNIPFVAVMQYYFMQEGFGTAAGAKRMYWANGTQSWISALTTYLTQHCKVNLLLNTTATVATGSSGPTVTFQPSTRGGKLERYTQQYDAVVFACHATASLRSITAGLTQDQASILSRFEYRQSVAIAHTYPLVMPQGKNAWRTYNIVIHDGYEELRPYTINYVINLHQNDPANPAYNRFDAPYILYSLNPHRAIPDKYVLRQPNGQPAIAYFPHNVLNFDALQAQAALWGTSWPGTDPPPNPPAPGKTIQGQNGLYFTGGWTLLAGLHEQCWHSALEVFNLIKNPSSDRQFVPDLRRGADRLMPDYWHELAHN